MKLPAWIWFAVGLSISSLLTTSFQSTSAASSAKRAVSELRSLKAEIAELRAVLEAKP